MEIYVWQTGLDYFLFALWIQHNKERQGNVSVVFSAPAGKGCWIDCSEDQNFLHG